MFPTAAEGTYNNYFSDRANKLPDLANKLSDPDPRTKLNY